MRSKKATINAIANIVTYVLVLLPTFIVRKVFLDILGKELLGLVSLYTNIINFLSIMELGIGAAIVFSLYKPYAEGNKEKIKGYIEYYKKFYRKIGLCIFVIGITIIPFLNILVKNEVNIKDARIIFVLFLINTVITYFFSHKLALLTVAQENYKISIGNAISKITISILQIIALYFIPNIYIYLILQIIIQLIYLIIINKYIDKKNTWFNKVYGKLEDNEVAKLTKNIKALFLHKIGGFLVLGTDNILISYFINLKIVALYNNYNMIIYAIQTIITNLFTGLTASIGNLLIEDDKEKAYKIHNNLFFFNFWLVSFIVISLFNTIDQFIALWVGYEFILDKFTVTILLINFYFYCMRQSLEQFKDSSGNYHQDRFAPIAEAVINLAASIFLIKIYGLPGVFLGTFVSNICVVFWTKPKVVYKYVFKEKLSSYFKMYFKYLFIGLIALGISFIFTKQIRYKEGIGNFLLNCIINVIVINGFYLIIFFRTKEFNYFKNMILGFYNKLICNRRDK